MGLRLVKEIKDSFEFKFEGEDSIDSEVLISSLKSFVLLVNEINKIRNPDNTTKIIINKTEKGSFAIMAVMALTINPNLLSIMRTGAGLFKSTDGFDFVLDAIKEMLDIKEKAGNQAFKTVNADRNEGIIQFFNFQGCVFNTPLTEISEAYLTNPVFDKMLSNISRDSSTRKGFSITSNTGSTIHKDKEQCSQLSEQVVFFDSEAEDFEEKITADVYWKRPDLEGESNWAMVYAGKKINAKIVDQEFLSKVKQGMRFGAGDKARVELISKYKRNPFTKEAVSEPKYEIIKVLED